MASLGYYGYGKPSNLFAWFFININVLIVTFSHMEILIYEETLAYEVFLSRPLALYTTTRLPYCIVPALR